ncbi:S8 family serine peptidase [Azospirillum sp. TSO22-1]|uniref:S8 family serine peptidase n=1 Tax=Azospirillum sp. TSO22-1 TaxID=716789 RepID=UPI000D6056BD|nr:S8 family serine peptidase [Azospirillum sp. TSO22-1]PWC32036.1 hypothetical protein TSO221_31750 [Azospirillum sp. TSO22-1]
METFAAVIAWALAWLPRVAVISLVLTAVLWLASQTVKWFIPDSGDPVPEFEMVGQTTADMKTFLPRLLNAEFMRIKADLASGADAVNRQLKAWEREFQETRRRRDSVVEDAKRRGERDRTSAQEAPATVNPDMKQVAASDVRGGVDLARVGEALKQLELLSTAITTTDVPDIKIANVELGPVLRWLIDLFRAPSTNKVVVFDSDFALIEGPIIREGRIILALDTPAPGAQRTAQQMVEPIAYHILSSKLSSKASIDFGGWTAMRDFVVGAKSLAKLVSEPKPGPAEMATWRADMVKAAQRVESAGVAAREWQFLALASFLFERAADFDNAIRILDRYAELAPATSQDDRKARLEYLRERRVVSAVSAALKTRPAGGAVFAATADSLANLPEIMAVQKLHRLGGVPDGSRVKVALVAGITPPWFGVDRPAEPIPLEGTVDQYGSQLAQTVRALTPLADVVFFPVKEMPSAKGSIITNELLSALDTAMKSDAPIIILPFGPLLEKIWARVFEKVLEQERLIIVPAGNSGPESADISDELASKTLVAESIDVDGTYSGFSSRVPGSLAAVGGALPYVAVTDAGPTVVVGSGTGFAAAALAAVAVETVARQPDLRGAALRDALVAAARSSGDYKPKIARVTIPR